MVVWIEVIIEQGRQIDAQDADEIAGFTEETMDELAQGVGSLQVTTRGVHCVRGVEVGDVEGVPITPENRMHCFIRVERDRLPLRRLDAVENRLRNRFDADGVSTGRGFTDVLVVDTEAVRQVLPQVVREAGGNMTLDDI